MRLFIAYVASSFDANYVYHDGWGTVLGHFDGISSATPDSTDYTTDPPTSYSTVTLTDGGGDQIVYNGVGTFVTSEDGVTFDLHGTGEWTGGTGRYADATGTTWYAGRASFVTFSGHYLQWGWIDLGD